jgi:branched-chain amino acid transport system substrate-binding protein
MKRLTLLTVASVVALSACQGTGSSNTIKIGYIGPLTGDAAGLGADTLHGAQVAVDAVNAAGGINGKQVEIVAEDGKCTGADAASAAQKLVNVDHVVAIIGGQCSGETLAAAPITEAAHVILLSPVSSSPDVTKAGDYVFRDYPSDELKTTAMAKLFKDMNLQKIAILSENTDFAQAFRKSLKSKLGAGAVVFDEAVDSGTKDFRTLMTRLKSVSFDAFVPDGNSDGIIGPMLQQFRDAGFTQTAISHDAADSATMAKNLPAATNGLYVINVPSSVNDPSFETTFKQKYGDPQYGIQFAGYAYDDANVLFAAFKAVGIDGSAVRDYLYGLSSFSGVSGTFHFDKNGDVVGIPYVLKKFESGSIVKVKDISLN